MFMYEKDIIASVRWKGTLYMYLVVACLIIWYATKIMIPFSMAY
jgi:hypothetical protein